MLDLNYLLDNGTMHKMSKEINLIHYFGLNTIVSYTNEYIYESEYKINVVAYL